MRQIAVAATVLACVISSPVSGHHSDARFDMEAVVAFQGVVTSVSWRNPHVYLNVETTESNGERINWEIQTGPTPVMARSGWSAKTFTPGEIVTVRGHPERDPERKYAILLTI